MCFNLSGYHQPVLHMVKTVEISTYRQYLSVQALSPISFFFCKKMSFFPPYYLKLLPQAFQIQNVLIN